MIPTPKIITLNQAKKIASRAQSQSKIIVLVGGCFDILHIGHISFLREAKKRGDVLIILLESDEKVKQLKGKNRPYFTQKQRAQMLSELISIDFIINLLPIITDDEYRKIIQKIQPDIIAVTENDPQLYKKKTHAEKINARLVTIPQIKMFSTTRVASRLGIE